MDHQKVVNFKNDNMVKKTALLIMLSLLISTGSALAHGVNVETTFKGGVVVVRSSFSPTQPLVDAPVTIYSPADRENAWQTGSTDKTGHFAFVPDVEGEWTFVVDDRKGHMKRTAIAILSDMPEGEKITEDEIVESTEPSVSGLSKTHKIIIGLSLIFGITGIFYGLKARQGPKK